MKAGELKADIVIVLLMIVYGIVIIGSSPALAVAAWAVASLLIMRHAYDPFSEFVDENQLVFFVFMLGILSAGFLFSWIL